MSIQGAWGDSPRCCLVLRRDDDVRKQLVLEDQAGKMLQLPIFDGEASCVREEGRALGVRGGRWCLSAAFDVARLKDPAGVKILQMCFSGGQDFRIAFRSRDQTSNIHRDASNEQWPVSSPARVAEGYRKSEYRRCRRSAFLECHRPRIAPAAEDSACTTGRSAPRSSRVSRRERHWMITAIEKDKISTPPPPHIARDGGLRKTHNP